MKICKLITILSLALLFVTEVFSQAAVDIPLFVTENNNPPIFEMAVGLDLTATNCIDTLLGEGDLQFVPFPPPGIFEIRFDLNLYGCPGVSSYKDYRAPDPPAFPFTGTIEHAVIWQSSAPGTSININYDIPFSAQMRITDQFGGAILNIGPFTGTGVAVIPGTYILQSALLFMDYTDIVPVELTSFTSTVLQNEKAIQLNWTTASETNNSGFEILRSAQNDKEWKAIGFVPGFGTTTEPKSYSFIDEDITTGTYNYRLKQIDFDGTHKYSDELEVEIDFIPDEFVLYQNYPNPFNPSTTIEYSLPVASNVKIKIFNAIGEVIKELVSEIQTAGTHNVVWNAQNHSSGIYYYSFEVASADGSQSHREMKKIVFLK